MANSNLFKNSLNPENIEINKNCQNNGHNCTGDNMTRESANNLKVDRNSTTHFKTSHTSPEGAKSLAQGSALGGNLNSSDIKCVGFTNPARVDTTVGDLIEAIADIASAAGKTEMQGLEMAREVLQKILAEKQKKMIIKDCE